METDYAQSIKDVKKLKFPENPINKAMNKLYEKISLYKTSYSNLDLTNKIPNSSLLYNQGIDNITSRKFLMLKNKNNEISIDDNILHIEICNKKDGSNIIGGKNIIP